MTIKFINGITINAASEKIDYPAVVMTMGDSGNAKIEVIDETGEFVSYL